MTKIKAFIHSRLGKKLIIGIVSAMIILATIIGSVIGGLLAYYNSDDMTLGGDKDMILRYNKSATKMGLGRSLSGQSRADNIWQQNSLPIGNGMMGGSVYGEVFDERVIFNEKTLWTGGPSQSRPDYNGGNLTGEDKDGKTVNDYYREVQRLLLAGKEKEASRLCNKLVGLQDGYGAYQCWGEVDIKSEHSFRKATDYERTLSLDDAIATVSYSGGGSEFSREYLASYPDRVLAFKLSAVGEEKLNLTISFPSSQAGAISVADKKSIRTYGALEDNQLAYYSRLDVVTGAETKAVGESIRVLNADEVVIIVAAATDYANVYPIYRTGESAEQVAMRVDAVVEKAVSKGYNSIKADHIADYQRLYDRVSLDLGSSQPDMTTDKLLKAYNSGFINQSHRRYIEELLYNYGRYLMISSSRETDILPSNLQGVWNNRNNPPWSSDYHMNVNLQMNYWPVYNTNLTECVTPLVDYVDSLREPGRVTAKTYAGVEGFVFHTQNTPFGWTCPGWEFSWGWSPAATAWIIQNVYEHYEYTGDKEYLRTAVYPIMREASLYFKSVLIDDGNGRLVSAPAYSPEHGPRTLGNTYEQSLIWQLFTDTVTAAAVLDTDKLLRDELSIMLTKLKPIEVGESGQIKEWYHESKLNKTESGSKIGESNHRHMSHLLGLFPGDLINKDIHPEWLEAAIVSLDDRGDKSTGWAMGQRINAWARTGDGDRSYKLIRQLFRSGLYANMWDAHPPFQIDGNFGYTSGVTEMLMQSNLGYIDVLPALPSEWIKGRLSGVVARGNFVLDMTWNEGKITSLTIKSNIGGVCALKLKPSMGIIADRIADIAQVDLERGVATFDTVVGAEYKII